MVDQAPIQKAQELIRKCIELVEGEQQTFTTFRLRADLDEALEALSAVQTVALPPSAPQPVTNLEGIDDGEPSAYELDKPYGMRIIREADKTTLVVGKPPQCFPIEHRIEFPKMETTDEPE